jgi:hypothetical protein
MKDLKDLLRRLSTALGSETEVRTAIKEAVQECTGGMLKDTDILFKEGVLSLSASPALKNEIRLKEDKVLACIKAKAGIRVRKIIYC